MISLYGGSFATATVAYPCFFSLFKVSDSANEVFAEPIKNAKLIKKVEVNREPRGWEKASDHTPVTITLEN